ncbi:MAG: AlkA N-terminal domain-containing protein, partial [Gemmatimonadota bacterium]
MTSDPAALYSAYAARDARFDGVFFVGVTSTRIYCRPVCTARTPKRGNCRFFDSAAAAEQASFRPCLRCRPELAPGNARVDGGRREAGRIAQRIAAGMFEEGAGVEDIAAEFFMSARHMRRIVHRELGVSPMQLVLTQRLLLAKQLLTETALTVTDVAYSSGFSSVRRFNDAFLRRYGMPPTRLRRQQAAPPGLPGELPPTPRPLTLQLAYRPPFDWSGMLGFVARRTLVGIEHVDGGAFSRTVRIGGHSGRIRVQDAPAGRVLLVEITQSLTPVLPALLARVRRLFDLDARPDVIAARLGRDPRFRRALARAPGLRVPGAFDGFELVVRAILGQQVTVRTAAAIAGRF